MLNKYDGRAGSGFSWPNKWRVVVGKLMNLRVNSSFRRYVDENRVLLGYYAALGSCSVPTFWDNLSVPYFFFLHFLTLENRTR
jgi:hypothetical protein